MQLIKLGQNYINLEKGFIRKDTISTKSGEKLLIPINMKDGSLLCVGKDKKEWKYFAPHGAGRLMSREKLDKI